MTTRLGVGRHDRHQSRRVRQVGQTQPQHAAHDTPLILALAFCDGAHVCIFRLGYQHDSSKRQVASRERLPQNVYIVTVWSMWFMWLCWCSIRWSYGSSWWCQQVMSSWEISIAQHWRQLSPLHDLSLICPSICRLYRKLAISVQNTIWFDSLTSFRQKIKINIWQKKTYKNHYTCLSK